EDGACHGYGTARPPPPASPGAASVRVQPGPPALPPWCYYGAAGAGRIRAVDGSPHRDGGSSPPDGLGACEGTPYPSPTGGHAMSKSPLTRSGRRLTGALALVLVVLAALAPWGGGALAQSRQETLIIARNIDDYVTNDPSRTYEYTSQMLDQSAY